MQKQRSTVLLVRVWRKPTPYGITWLKRTYRNVYVLNNEPFLAQNYNRTEAACMRTQSWEGFSIIATLFSEQYKGSYWFLRFLLVFEVLTGFWGPYWFLRFLLFFKGSFKKFCFGSDCFLLRFLLGFFGFCLFFLRFLLGFFRFLLFSFEVLTLFFGCDCFF